MLFKSSAIVFLIAVSSFTASGSTDPISPENGQSTDELAAAEKMQCSKHCNRFYDFEELEKCVRDVCKSDKTVPVSFEFYDPTDGVYTPCEKDCFKKAIDPITKCQEECNNPPPY